MVGKDKDDTVITIKYELMGKDEDNIVITIK